MVKFRKILPLLLCLLLTGCSRPPKPESRLVTGIQVQATRDGQVLERSYTDPQKMETVLYYLRALNDRQPVSTDPERFAGRHYRISLSYSDGSTRLIFQHADRFLSEGFGPWQRVDQNKAAFLYPLLQSIPGDANFYK